MKPGILKCCVLVLFNAMAYCLQGQDNAGVAINKENKAAIKSDYIITNVDADKIKRSAFHVVKEFENVLNTLSILPGMDSSEVSEMIRNRYSDEKRRIFYDSSATIEDDIWRTTGNDDKKLQVKPVRRYLSDFDIYYRKNDSKTVSFSNIETSNVKKRDYLYVLVFYDCLFGGRSKFSDKSYTASKRVAELKVEKVEDKWRVWIINVHFLSPADTLNKDKNDLRLVTAGNKNETDSLFNSGKRFLKLGQLREAEENLHAALSMEPQNAMYRYTLAELYRQKTQYKEAIDRYSKELKINANPPPGIRPEIEIGNIYLEMKQPDSAYNWFNKIYLLDANDADAAYGIAVALVQKKEFGWALGFFENAFSFGKMQPRAIKEDRRLDEIKESKAFKSLMRKYF